MDGSAWCWGASFVVPYEASQWSARAAPAPVPGGLRFISLTVGGSHACGVTADSVAWCWGRNDAGQLGASTTERCEPAGKPCATNPVAVSGDLTFRSLTAGASHTCGLTTDAHAYCWGSNNEYQLGVPQTLDQCYDAIARCQYSPVAAALVPALISLQAGPGANRTCGIVVSAQTVVCWGSEAELAVLAQPNDWVPSVEGGAVTYSSVVSGFGHICALRKTGTPVCWGANNQAQLGVFAAVSRP
jgi:alpha-tubulin suppressor-like RCC1 family protein